MKQIENAYKTAFPSEFLQNLVGESGSGLTKRDLFAVVALNGMLSNSVDTNQGVEPWWHGGPEKLADESVRIAEALLKRLEKPIEE